MKLSTEQLKELRALCNDSTAWASVLDELISIRELKGDQVPVASPAPNHAQCCAIAGGDPRYCDCVNKDHVYLPSADANYASNSQLAEYANGYHCESGLRVKAMAQELLARRTAPQKLTDLPYDVLFNAIAKSATPLGEHMSISVKDFKASIEAAGGIVKDGE